MELYIVIRNGEPEDKDGRYCTGSSTIMRPKMCLLTKYPHFGNKSGFRQEKRRLPASVHASYRPFEIQGRGRKEAVVLHCL